ncbi:30S ribosomal protein S8 [Campylobacter showae CC57C]|uniref:30S ribosomal protein S8 n=2 Tax=Campylobacter showae TaxID=204 RepID=M3GWJ5_9BACT|nr:30S ribosomal protein S8 [Campylobacter showae CC57C]
MFARKRVFSYIKEKFGAQGERLFDKHPEFAVFRHAKNQKWFTVFMRVDGDKLGFKSGEELEILNLKCKPDLAAILRDGDQILPAYHMNKKHWISVNLSSKISPEQVEDLIDLSFELTK